MGDPKDEQDARPSRADVDDLADAAIGVDTRIFTTIQDTLLHTPRVVEAAFAGDREKYVPIIRLFLVLFGAQYAVFAFFGLPVGLTLENFADSTRLAVDIPIWLEAGGHDYESVNRRLEQAVALTATPLTFLSSMLYILLLKAYRPSRSLFGHALAYLVTVNASYLVLFLIMGVIYLTGIVLSLPRDALISGFLFSLGFSMVWFFVATVRVLARFYAKSALVVTLQTLGLVLLFFPMIILITISQFLIAELVLQAGFDLSIMDLFQMTAEHSIEDVS